MITQGLLWYDDNPSRPPEETIRRAANRYETKYGKKPNRCYVNRGMAGLAHVQHSVQALGIEVEAIRSVLPYHFWLGIAA
jgi:hypothetical protein